MLFALGNLQKFNITVKESVCKNLKVEGKCVQVTWNHYRMVDSRSNYFIVHYRMYVSIICNVFLLAF